MKFLNQEDASNLLNEQKEKGFHVDSRLLEEVKKDGRYFIIDLKDKESFLSLIWQESDPGRLLTPRNQTRCLSDVGKRFIDNNYTFEKLSEPMGLSSTLHDPEWFRKCNNINDKFDFNHFGLLAIVPSTDGERQQSAHGTFYIYDGMHKSLVLTIKLLKEEIEYQNIQALLMIPRRK
jgi:hypothetical protein